MKKFAAFPALIVALTILFTSCKKDPEDRLPGDWDMVWTITTSANIMGVQESDTDIETGTVKFDEDGTGIMTIDGDAMAITWSATEDKVTIIIDGEGVVFDVIENERKTQKWEYSITETETDYEYDEDFNAVPYTYSYTMKIVIDLDKQ